MRHLYGFKKHNLSKKKKKLLKESCSSLNGKFPEIRKCIKVKNHV